MLTAGKILRNRYTIVKSLGNGDFGDTYLAKDSRNPENPRCVIKHLQPKDSSSIVLDTARRIFETEAKTLADLGKQSPQIPTLLAHFEERGEFYLVWEFIDGDNLTKEIIPGKKLTEVEVIALLKSILEVLVVAHAYKLYTVIHRDIKPENIIRRRDGKIVLVDFGGIREINQLVVNDKGDVAPAIAIGTPGYQSREQARGKSQPASDIYALGMLGIQALTGLNLRSLLTLKDANTGEIVWRNLVPDVDPRLAEVLETMVFDRFLSRYQNAREALQAISSLIPRQIPIIGTIGKFLEQPIARRRVLQLGGLTGVGLVLEIGSQKLVNKSGLGNESVKTPESLLGKELGNESVKTPQLKVFQFQTMKVDARGAIIDRLQGQAEYFTEDLGNGITLDMVKIPGGTFLMGSPTTEAGYSDNQGPQHQVIVPSFYMGRYAVTQEQYEIITGTNPSRFKGKKRPVENVSWNNTGEFCQKLLEKTGKKYRLSSEAEWEYACRAGTTTPFYFGETITPELVNYKGDLPYSNAAKGVFRKETTDVGSFPPNAFGLYDMHGNVWQWLADRWHDNYNSAPTDGSSWETGTVDDLRVLRGGSWYGFARSCRAGDRHRSNADSHDNGFGFRVACRFLLPGTP